MPLESTVSYISQDFKSYFYCCYFLDILSLVTSFISFLTQNMGWKEGFLLAWRFGVCFWFSVISSWNIWQTLWYFPSSGNTSFRCGFIVQLCKCAVGTEKGTRCRVEMSIRPTLLIILFRVPRVHF